MTLKRLLGPIEIGLMSAIFVFGFGGVVYAGLAGFIALPGVPSLLADKQAPVERQAIVFPSPEIDLFESPSPEVTASSESVSPEPSPITSAAVVPTPSSIPSPSPALSPAPSPIPSPSVAPSPSPTPDAKALAVARDKQRLEELIPKLQVALTNYKKKYGKFPISASYDGSWTNEVNTPLKVLVSEKFIDALPQDPQPERRFGYKSVDGKTYTITVTLEDTSRAGGVFGTDPVSNKEVYIYTIYSP